MADGRPIRWALRHPLVTAAGVTLAGLVVVGALAHVVAPYSPTAVDSSHVFNRPGGGHLFGTDRFGRDLFSRVLFGIRVSLGIVSNFADVYRFMQFAETLRDQTRLTIGDVTFDIESCRVIRDGS